eukprot:gene13248-13028_t
MRPWLPLALVSLLLCTAAAAEPEYWGDADFHKEYGDSVAICAKYRKVEPPAADRPTAAQLAALKGCDSADAYYGITFIGDGVKARHCAFAEMARNENDGPAGAGVLMMLYANGRGVKENLPYAIRMACTVGGAPFEVQGRIAALQARMKGEGTGAAFDFCDDVTSGYGTSQCAMIGSRVQDHQRDARLAELGRGWTPAQKAAWDKVIAAETAYADAMTSGEVDLSGTMRGVFALEAEGEIKTSTLGLLEALPQSLDKAGPGQLQKSDAALNAAWKKVMASSFEDAGTVTQGGVRNTQRAWIKYRDAWSAFANLTWPGMGDTAADYLTKERTNALLCLIGHDACAVDYDRHQHRVYARARAIAPDMLTQWMDVFDGVLPARRPLAILDLGSGTGRFTPALAARFGGPVTGVEPSEGMRRTAEAQGTPAGVRYLAGGASAIPLDDGTVDAVLMLLSFHHFPDKALAAREIARVLAPGGRVLLRGVFSDRPVGEWYVRFFPRLEEIGRHMFPTLETTTEAFAAAGLRPLDLIEVEETYSTTAAEAVEKIRLKGISTFDHLTEAELTDGFAALDRALEVGDLHILMTGRSDLL